MFEKLLLAAALTLSVQIFSGGSPSAQLPSNYVFRSLQIPEIAPKPANGCSTIACSGDRLKQILWAARSVTYSR